MAVTSFYVDQAQSFTQVVLADVEPKMAFGKDEQDRTKDGIPLWTVQLIAQQVQFGRKANEVLKCTIASKTDPSDGIPPFAPVRVHGFQVGVMASTKRDRETGTETITGASVYFRADRIEAAIKSAKQSAPAA